MDQEQGMSAALMAFLDWIERQDTRTKLSAGAYAHLIREVLANQRMVNFGGMVCPDFWLMELATAALRDLADGAGFAEAAAYCEQYRQFACGSIEMACLMA